MKSFRLELGQVLTDDTKGSFTKIKSVVKVNYLFKRLPHCGISKILKSRAQRYAESEQTFKYHTNACSTQVS